MYQTTIDNGLRTSMISSHDGEDMTLQAGAKSIMEYIRILNFNPYSLGEGNPFRDIPLDFLIYNGAYPIRYNVDTRLIEIAKQSVPVNIRIYNLKNTDYNITTLGKEINEEKSNVWREIKYYKYVREELHNKKICPNFISLILYKLDKISNIKYDELEQIIKGYKMIPDSASKQAKLAELYKLLDANKLLSDFMKTWNDKNKSPIQLGANSGCSLLALTEAPTCNIIEWGSPVYEREGAINRQISTGYHAPSVWKSILFQLCYAVSVLQDKNIYIREFSLANNVFIKDLFNDPNNTGHWVYCVNDIKIGRAHV